MSWTRSMTRNQKTSRPWSDLNHDLLLIVMMKLGFGDYFSFRGVCKSWRLLAHYNKNKFMASGPPMSISLPTYSNQNVCCCLDDFEGRKYKTIFPRFAGGEFVGFTCGYLIFFTKKTHNFCLVNPITRKEFHFADFPFNYIHYEQNRAILVFSLLISGWAFVVLCRGEIWACIVGKGDWKHVPYSERIHHIKAFKGKIYTLTRYFYHLPRIEPGVCELGLNAEPKFTKIIHGSGSFLPQKFVISGEKLYVVGRILGIWYELDIGEMKWVVLPGKTLPEYAFFCSMSNRAVVAVKRESWADPRSRSQLKFALSDFSMDYRNYKCFKANMWYFPHECVDVDHKEE